MSKFLTLNAFDWIKGAIVAVLVAVLTCIQQMLTDGGQINLSLVGTTAITSLIGYLIKQLMTDNNGAILKMVGGRKKRKKPTGFPQDNIFTFEGQDFNLSSVVTYTSDLINNYPIKIVAVYDNENSQSVKFSLPIEYNDFESLYFEVEVD